MSSISHCIIVQGRDCGSRPVRSMSGIYYVYRGGAGRQAGMCVSLDVMDTEP